MAAYTQRTAYLHLHISVFLFGFTAILGALISLSGVVLVWYRLLLTVLVYVGWLAYRGQLPRLPWRQALHLAGIGLVLGIHWITFYGAIKLANASVALVCLSSATFFTSVLDPLFYRRSISRREVLLGLVVLLGIYLIYHFQPAGMEWGIVVGVVSALFSALTGMLNKRVVNAHPGALINTYELGGCFVIFSVLMPLYLYLAPAEALLPAVGTRFSDHPWLGWLDHDWFYLILLSLVCTNLAYNLSMNALRHISTFNFILAINLEPIYGIVLAVLLLGENRELNWGFVLGCGLVFASVFFNVILRYIGLSHLEKH